jgi:hypothetical protein
MSYPSRRSRYHEERGRNPDRDQLRRQERGHPRYSGRHPGNDNRYDPYDRSYERDEYPRYDRFEGQGRIGIEDRRPHGRPSFRRDDHSEYEGVYEGRGGDPYRGDDRRAPPRLRRGPDEMRQRMLREEDREEGNYSSGRQYEAEYPLSRSATWEDEGRDLLDEIPNEEHPRGRRSPAAGRKLNGKAKKNIRAKEKSVKAAKKTKKKAAKTTARTTRTAAAKTASPSRAAKKPARRQAGRQVVQVKEAPETGTETEE